MSADPTDNLVFGWAPTIMLGAKKQRVGPYPVIHFRGAVAVLHKERVLVAARWDGKGACFYAYCVSSFKGTEAALARKVAEECRAAWDRHLSGPGSPQLHLGDNTEET